VTRQIEDDVAHTQQLVLVGKARGYLLYDEVNESLPVEVTSPEEIDDLLSILERQGIEIYEDLATLSRLRLVKRRTLTSAISSKTKLLSLHPRQP
jgi:hypothetical protein